ncbi:MAG: hypothetical protein JSS30_05090 [Verrucomicrobia bacterium]|nr:hypothetical protein [Verrucomicrobiota bacterium]
MNMAQVSPRTEAEKVQLDAILDPSRVVIGPVQVLGRYSVVVHPDPKEAVIPSFNDTSKKLQALQRVIPNGSEVEILRALITPTDDMRWYRDLYEEGVNELQEFRNFSLAKLHLLAAVKLSTQGSQRDVFRKIYETASSLHARWIEKNKQWAASELQEAKTCVTTLNELYKLFLDEKVNVKYPYPFFSKFTDQIKPLILLTERERDLSDFEYDTRQLIETIKLQGSELSSEAKDHLAKAADLLEPIARYLSQLGPTIARADFRKEIELMQSYYLPVESVRTPAAVNCFGIVLKKAVEHHFRAIAGVRESLIFEGIIKEEKDLFAVGDGPDGVQDEIRNYQGNQGLVSRNMVTLEALLEQRTKEMA